MCLKSSAWQSQLRFYWILKEDNLFLKQCNGKFQYGLRLYFRLNLTEVCSFDRL